MRLDAREAAACTAWQECDDQARRSPAPCPPHWESAQAVFGEGNLSSEKHRGSLGGAGGGRASDSKVIQVSAVINLLLKEGAGRAIKEPLYLRRGRSMGSHFRE